MTGARTGYAGTTGEGRRAEARTALAAVAAVSGAGMASGREQVLFFAQLGWAGWIGILLAAALYAALLGAICGQARRLGADNLPGLYWKRLGPAAGAVAAAMHAILMVMIAVMMLCSAARIGALTLPFRHGALWGAVLALSIALLVNLNGLRALPWMGLLAAALGAAFYLGLAVDPRPVRIWLRGETALALRGNLPAAVALAALYAALNAAVAGGAVARLSGGGAKPVRAAMLSGTLLCALLLCANAAILRGGDRLLGQAMPTVILAARWGKAGFWLCAGFSFFCASATLSAALGSLPRTAVRRRLRTARGNDC